MTRAEVVGTTAGQGGRQGRLQLLLLSMSILAGASILLLSQIYSIGVTDIGFILLVAGIASIVLVYSSDKAGKSKETSYRRHYAVWGIILLLIVASLLYSRIAGYHRPLEYFVLVSFTGALIGFQLMISPLERGRRLIPIFTICAFALSVWAAIFFNYPTLIGADVWAHADFASFIQSYGGVPPKEVYSLVQYTDFPLLHILFVTLADLFGASMKVAIFIASATAALVTMLFVYLMGREVAGERAGLLAMFLLGISDMFLVNNVTLIMPQSLVIAWFAGVIYLVLRKSIDPSSVVVMILFLLAIIPTHQVSLFITMVALVAILIGKVMYELVARTKRKMGPSRERSILRAPHINVQMVALFIVATFSYWVTSTARGSSGKSFLAIMVEVVMRAIERGLFSGNPTSNPFANSLGGYDIITAAMYHLGFLILLFFAICGFVLFFGRGMLDVRKFAIFCALFVLGLIAYGSPLTGLRDAVLPERWVPFMYVFLVIAASVAIIATLRRTRKPGVRAAAAGVIAFLVVFCMLTTPYVSADNPIFEKDRVARSAFTYSEVSSASFFAGTFNGSLYSDQVFGGRVFTYQVAQPHNVTVITFNDVSWETMFQDKANGSVVLLRLSLLNEPTIVSKSYAFGSSQMGYIGSDIARNAMSSYSDKVYASDSAVAYI